MKPFRVLLPCCNVHVKDIIDCLKNNYDNVPVKVFVTNCSEADLPPLAMCDGAFVTPKVTDPEYCGFLLNLCKTIGVDVILPISSVDLDFMSEHKDVFESNGIRVSAVDYDIMRIANNKIELSKMFGQFMPKEMIPETAEDVQAFSDIVGGKVCCKVADLCGGKGFAVVDDVKCDDVNCFHRFGVKHYISLEQLKRIVASGKNKVILQEFNEGLDYTISLVADHGKIRFIAGYVGYQLEFGSIMYGEIKRNEDAFRIAEVLVRELNLDGNIGIDFILKPDGSVVLLEINPRVNASLPFVAAAGCNMIYLRCKQLMGESIDESHEVVEHYKMKKHFATRYYV